MSIVSVVPSSPGPRAVRVARGHCGTAPAGRPRHPLGVARPADGRPGGPRRRAVTSPAQGASTRQVESPPPGQHRPAVRPAQWVGDAPAPFLDVGRPTGAADHVTHGAQMTASTTTTTITRSAARAANVEQVLRRRRRRRARARQRQRRPGGRRVHRDHGPVGLRQVDPAARARRPRPPDLGRGLPRRHRDHLAQGQGAHPAAPGPDRLHLPVVQPAPDHDRGREHRAADADRRPQAGRATGCSRSSRPSVSPSASRTVRRSSPAASSSASPPLARWPAGRRSSSRTSRPAPSTRAPAPSCSGSCGPPSASSARPSSWSPTTPSAAGYADRVLFLADGQIVDEMREPTADAVLDYMKHLGA